MVTTCTFDATANELRIRVAENFDVEDAKVCLQFFSGFRGDGLGRLVFDLSGTQQLYTAGLGTMLYIHMCCRVSDEEAHIIYQHASVGMTLRLANLDRWFKLLPQGTALQDDRMPWDLARVGVPAHMAS